MRRSVCVSGEKGEGRMGGRAVEETRVADGEELYDL